MPESCSSKETPKKHAGHKAPGYVYDPVFLEHDTGSHPENAHRLEAIISDLDWKGIRGLFKRIAARPATLEELTTVHTKEYIARVEAFCRRGGGSWDADTPMSEGSYKAALYAAGGGMAATGAVIKGDVPQAFVLVRPPGHHATANNAMGFCIFNNIAVAANHALKTGKIKRALIIDFDVHHGNGTQEAFARNPDVLYISMHEYPLFPGTGYIDEVEQGKQEAATINIPLPAGCGDGEYRQAFEGIVGPAARRFGPEIILVSAGYDAHWADNLGNMRLSLDGYHVITRTIQQLADGLCGGKTVFFLEGGYNLKVLTSAVNMTFYTWLGEKLFDDPLGPAPQPQNRPRGVDEIIAAIKQRHGLSQATA